MDIVKESSILAALEMHSIASHALNQALWRAVWLDDLETVKWALEKGGRLTNLEHPPFYYREPALRDARFEKYTPDWATETKWTVSKILWKYCSALVYSVANDNFLIRLHTWRPEMETKR